MRSWGPLLAVCLTTFMLLLDVSIVVVGLPEMARTLHASLAGLQWVIDAYALALAALLLGAGAAADRFGRRRVQILGTSVFALASLACGLAPSAGALVAARAVQGAGAAGMFATTLPLLGAVYEGPRRSQALGVWGAVSGAAAALGPVVGGLLVSGPGWRWVFFVNLPVSAVALLLARGTLAESYGSQRRTDWAGTAAFAGFAAALTVGAVRAADGWTAPGTLAAFAAAAAAAVVFALVERRSPAPLLDLSLLRRPAFSGVLAGAFAFNAVAFAVLPYVSVWLQTLLGMSAVRGGLAVLPLAGTSFAVAALGGRLLHGVAPHRPIGIGLLLIGAGTAAQGILGPGSSWPALLPGLFAAGLGTGLVSPALAAGALAAVPAERAGMAGGAVNTARQLGYALGVAVFGTVLVGRMARSGGADPLGADRARALAGGAAQALREGGVPERALRAAFASGLDAALLTAGAVGVLAGAAVLAAGRRGPRP